MVVSAGEGYVLLGKKLYGLFSIILGCVLTVVGVSSASMGVTALGILALIVGVVLLVLKIVRRNQSSQIR
jgi:hypothetical protein